MRQFYDLKAVKKSANLSVNSDLLAQAKEVGINLSSTLEAALIDALNERRNASWSEENHDAPSSTDFNGKRGA